MRAPYLVLSCLLAGLTPSIVEALTQPSPAQKSYPENSQRGNTRIFYWGAKGASASGGSIGQLALDYGQPVWKDAYDAAVESKRDYRWRLGQNFWTNLDTNIDLKIGGVDVSAGYRYLALEHTSEDEFILWAIDPSEAYEDKIDAFHAHFTKGGLRIPMEYELREAKAPKLSIRLATSATARDEASLTIDFGPHRLTADVEMIPQ